LKKNTKTIWIDFKIPILPPNNHKVDNKQQKCILAFKKSKKKNLLKNIAVKNPPTTPKLTTTLIYKKILNFIFFGKI